MLEANLLSIKNIAKRDFISGTKLNPPYNLMVDLEKISFGWRKNTTDEPLAISKLLLVVRAWIDEQNRANIYFQLIIKLNQKI